jgi:hypothetical protein
VDTGQRVAAAGRMPFDVMRLDEVRRVEKIPMLGTGKIDYQRLRAMVAEGTLVTVSPPSGRSTQ